MLLLAVLALSLSPQLSATKLPPASAGSPVPKWVVLWANDGGDKVTRDELRASNSPVSVRNSVWDGRTVRIFGARNEVLSFNLVIEAALEDLTDLTVHFDRLVSDQGHVIASAPTSDLFDWTQRPIELFFVRYLQVRGLSRLSYGTYDERHVPERLRRPFSGAGIGTGTWFDRPDHDKDYPEIAVPLELHHGFDVAAGTNQSIWVDVYVPKDAVTGLYRGKLRLRSGGQLVQVVPVELDVLDFTLPDDPSAETMAVLGYADINLRYTGMPWPNCGTAEDAKSKLVRDRHFQMAHRHGVSLIDSETSGCSVWTADSPRPAWEPRLDGSLFTAANGYAGPGAGVGNGVYSIGTYGSWWWKGQGEAAMQVRSDGWVSWFEANAPTTEYFLYLVDESTNYPQTEQWASWIENNPGPGQRLMSMATLDSPVARVQTPALDVPASWMRVGIPQDWESATAHYESDPTKRWYLYNGHRPAGGSFATEDDGVALRVLTWAQYKKGVDRWFYWETTYYNNYQGGMGQTDVFESAHTFGSHSSSNSVLGETGWNYSNGDGVLFYPGTDTVYPGSSYGIDGPIASLRLKHWRRGVQDYEYLSLAAAVDSAAVDAIVLATVPVVLWEYGVTDPNDPTWVRTDISWSTDPGLWEAARAQLAAIITGG